MAATYFWLLGIVQLVLCCFLVYEICGVPHGVGHTIKAPEAAFIALPDTSFNILAQIKSVDDLLIWDHNSHVDFFQT